MKTGKEVEKDWAKKTPEEKKVWAKEMSDKIHCWSDDLNDMNEGIKNASYALELIDKLIENTYKVEPIRDDLGSIAGLDGVDSRYVDTLPIVNDIRPKILEIRGDYKRRLDNLLYNHSKDFLSYEKMVLLFNRMVGMDSFVKRYEHNDEPPYEKIELKPNLYSCQGYYHEKFVDYAFIEIISQINCSGGVDKKFVPNYRTLIRR